jgi:sialidase-1
MSLRDITANAASSRTVRTSKMSRSAVTFLTTLAVFAPALFAAEIERTTVWRAGEGAYKIYRIPSAIVTTSAALLVLCEGRKNGAGDSGEINLISRRSTDNGKTFSDTSVLWSDGKNTCGNPCAVVDRPTGTIWLLMTHNPGEDHEPQLTTGESRGKRTVWITSSTDDGVTWSKPRDITDSVSKPDWTWYATGPGVGIQLQHDGPHKGRLIVPCDHVGRGGKDPNAHVIFSDDHGQTWHLGGEPPQRQYNESQVVELSDGRLMLNMRNHKDAIKAGAPRQRGVAISSDGGESFADARRDPALSEPICQGSIIRAGGHVLFSNPSSEKNRANMTVRISDDDGQTWPRSLVIHPGPSAYSCLVALADGSVGLLFECGEEKAYERIDFARFQP